MSKERELLQEIYDDEITMMELPFSTATKLVALLAEPEQEEREVSGKIISTDDVCNWNLTVGGLKDYDHVYVNGVRYVEFQPEQTEQEDIRDVWQDGYEVGLRLAKREPIEDGELEVWYSQHAWAMDKQEYMWGFRDAEKAHGIGGEE